ncbi:hypothetical protein [Streptomyces sp. NPDC058595]|uniref:hypothetical protein n=1 Tax=Streptomyces sp. NPDC058595 TaxID=3346550 RepID=UPI0036670472
MQLVDDGMVLDEMPDDLPAEDAPFETPCILLSRAASPGMVRPSRHVLRPYAATGPTVKDAESPLSELLPALGADGLRTAVRAGIEMYGEYGDPQHALSEEQVRQLCRAAAIYA